MTGSDEIGKELKDKLRPSIRLELVCNKERFEMYFENKFTNAKGIMAGIPQQ